MSNFHLDLYDQNGVRKAVLSDALTLNYQVKVNYPGNVTFTLHGDHEMASQILPGWRCDVWRQLPNGTWRKEFMSFVEGINWQYTDRPEITYTGAGLLSILSKRVVAYYANTTDKTAFQNYSSELIAKLLVRDNVGYMATTANGRLLNGVITNFDYESSQNRGVTLNWFCAWENLLTTLQKLAKAGGFDFDVLPFGAGYRFYWYLGQLGTDRTSSVIFSLERGNMSNPRHNQNVSGAANVAVVGGKGEDSLRQIQVVQGVDYSTLTHSETFLDATDVDTAEALIDRGEGKLAELNVSSKFEFEILQSEYSNWNVDYFLGDLVKVISPRDGSVFVSKIDSAVVSFTESGSETIEIGVE